MAHWPTRGRTWRLDNVTTLKGVVRMVRRGRVGRREIGPDIGSFPSEGVSIGTFGDAKGGIEVLGRVLVVQEPRGEGERNFEDVLLR